jgi:tol-pal system protein YbgF
MRDVVTGLRRNVLILAAVSLFLAGGCIAVEKKVRPIEEENLEIVELKKAVSGLYMKTEEMNNRLFLLQEKADTSDERIDVLEGDPELKNVKQKDEKEEGASADEDMTEEVVRDEPIAQTHSILFTESDDAEEGIVAPQELAAVEVEATVETTAEELYETGMKDLKNKDYAAARFNFIKLYENYPDHSLADNALYWTGECHYVERNYEKALESFEVVISKYPDGNKVADAMLKTAYAYISLKDRGNTIKALNLLIEKYPDSEAATKANERFKRKK